MPRLKTLTLSLVAVLLMTACAPAATVAPATTDTPVPAATQTLEMATQPQVQPEAATVIPMATSRGPNLEATDPSTVNLASGGLQLVEFFRFT